MWFGDQGLYLAWSPDGRYLIASLRDATETAARLYRVSVDSGEMLALTAPDPNLRGDTGPAVTGDGKRLAFVRLTTRQVGDLYLLDLTDDLEAVGDPTRLSETNSWISSPRWLPDEKSLLYAAGWLGSTALWTIEAGPGAKPQKLPMLRDDIHLPALSSDGRKLVYTRRIENHNIWALDLGEDGASSGLGARRDCLLRVDSTRIPTFRRTA